MRAAAEALVSDKLVCHEAQVTYSELFERYAASELGQYHAGQVPRYSGGFAYEPGQMLSDLGDDVHPVEHGRYTHDEIVIPLLHVQNQLADGSDLRQFTADEITSIRLAAHIHDFGECEHPDLADAIGYTVGDVAYGTKTQEDEQGEQMILSEIRRRFYEDIPNEIWEPSMAIVDGKSDEPAVRAFALAEHAGYYVTGLRAGYLALVETLSRRQGVSRRDDESLEQLTRLSLEVTSRHRHETLPAKTEGFAYGYMLLKQTTEMYEAIHDTLREPANA